MNYEYVIFNFDVKGIDMARYPDASKHPRVTSFFTCVVRTVVMITTIVSIGCMFKREQLRCQQNHKYFDKVDQ